MGLSSDLFWSLSHAEFYAMKRVWAASRAEVFNLHANTEGVAFTIEDVMDPESRPERVSAIKAERELAEALAAAENLRLGSMKAHGVDEDEDSEVPAWAKGKHNGR